MQQITELKARQVLKDWQESMKSLTDSNITKKEKEKSDRTGKQNLHTFLKAVEKKHLFMLNVMFMQKTGSITKNMRLN